MKDTWQLPLKPRLRRWRSFRKEIEAIESSIEQLQVVVDFWKTTPLATRIIDPYDIGTWPNPWEMLNTNEYDENVVALGMAYTLHYSNINCRILLVQNIKNREIKLIVLVDELHILNYNYDSVDTLEIMKEIEILTDTKVSDLHR